MILVRVLLLLLGLLLGYGVGVLLSLSGFGAEASTANTVYLMAAGLLVAFLLGERIASVLDGVVERGLAWLSRLDPRRVTAATVGLVVALVVAVLVTTLLSSAPFFRWYWSVAITALLSVFFVYFAVQNAGTFGALAYSGPPRRRSNAKVLDTNVIIDGRVTDLARSGFLEGELIVPSFVLREVQYQADHADPQRRTRGKRALGVLEELREIASLRVEEWDVDGDVPVDDKLVRFTREYGAKLVTNDSNLSKVARLYGLKVLSIHEAALALRPKLQAGEVLDVTVTKAGQQSGQGVAYLEDGTMIVVEDGLRHKGKQVRVTVLSNVQTSVGRMVFAKVAGE
ncbi:PIN/TRAM domain-containing protein [Deinococcus pimensis]|uniref:PIN/TRAM domain-containing protein n=1 Tax=Deinococcus pimensis TaxID=309888 RepID=UPI00048A2BD7|nr:PIN domain-containing protein [Deinococcus pimensis]